MSVIFLAVSGFQGGYSCGTALDFHQLPVTGRNDLKLQFQSFSGYNFSMSINNREYDRFPFQPGMWVKVVRYDQKISDFKMYQLIDLSQGGISFKSHAAKEFKRGDKFYILEVEAEVLDDPIRAIVRYVKPMDEFGVDYKVGVEFLGKV